MINIKSKLLILSTLPMIIIFMLSTLVLIEIFHKKEDFELAKKDINNAMAISKIVHLLQLERGLNTELIANPDSGKKEKLHSSKQQLNKLLQNTTLTNCQHTLAKIIEERKSLDTKNLTINELHDFYSLKIATLLDIASTLSNSMNDAQNRTYINAYAHLVIMKEMLGQTRTILNKSFIKKEIQEDDYAKLDVIFKTYRVSQSRFENNLSAFSDLFYSYTKSLDDEKNREVFGIIEFVLNNKKSQRLEAFSHEWFEKITYTIESLNAIESALFINVNKALEKKQKSNFNEMILVFIFLIISSLALIYEAITIVKEILASTDSLESNLYESTSLLEQYKSVVDESEIVSKTNPEGIITYVNDKFCTINGYTQNELLGKSHNIIHHTDMPKEVFRDLWHTVKILKQPWLGDVKNKKKDGSAYWAKTFIKPILDANEEVIEFIAIRTDITKIVEQKSLFEMAAKTDTLTNYGNRYKLSEDIKEKENLSIAIFNIDNFRELNDFYGHHFGDSVIKSIADKIYNFISNDDKLFFYRLQGDEFALLATQQKQDIFTHICKEILLSMKESLIIQNEKIVLSCSCGIAFDDKEHLLSNANMALKLAKQTNNDFIIYNDDISLNNTYANNIRWTKKLAIALQNDNIITHYQPIVSNRTLKYEKYEALVRMIDEDGATIAPFYFLDISKKTKKYFDITKLVIAQSFEMFKTNEIEFSINLSVMDIAEPQILDYIVMMLQRYSIGSRVVFEIVESEYIENFNIVTSFIDEVKKYGCKIAIDDFGTGYSNFEYLIKLKADYLKIDGSLIKNINTDYNAFLVVSTIVEFSKKLNMQTIAEFVENEEVFKIVQQLGIDYSQGYYFSTPKEKL